MIKFCIYICTRYPGFEMWRRQMFNSLVQAEKTAPLRATSTTVPWIGLIWRYKLLTSSNATSSMKISHRISVPWNKDKAWLVWNFVVRVEKFCDDASKAEVTRDHLPLSPDAWKTNPVWPKCCLSLHIFDHSSSVTGADKSCEMYWETTC